MRAAVTYLEGSGLDPAIEESADAVCGVVHTGHPRRPMMALRGILAGWHPLRSDCYLDPPVEVQVNG